MAELHQVAGAPYLRPPVVEVTREPLPYTGTPWKLLLSDFGLFLKNFFYLPYIFVPLWPWPSGPLDELYPSASNLIDIAFHTVLFFTQLGFFISLFILTFLPAWSYFSYIVGFLITNELICRHFNRSIPQDGLKSTEDARTRRWARHDDEYWIFLNGICVG
jgi:fatty acid desaturase